VRLGGTLVHFDVFVTCLRYPLADFLSRFWQIDEAVLFELERQRFYVSSGNN